MDFREFLKSQDINSLSKAIKRRFYDPLRKRYRGYAGIDGVTSYNFIRKSRTSVKSVITKVLKRGKPDVFGKRSATKFTFTPFKRFEIDKPNGAPGEKRPISTASISSIILQTPTAQFLTTKLDPLFCKSSFGYRKNRSAKQAVKVISIAISKGYTFALDADIRKFFDTVDHAVLLQLIRQHFPDDELLETIIRRYLKTGWVKSPPKGLSAKCIRSPKRGGYKSNHIGIPQGGILSGLLANLYLHDLDLLIEENFPKAIYVRYADDFVLLAKTQDEVKNARRRITDFLKNRLVDLHTDKTKEVTLTNTNSLDFLGYRFYANRTIIKPKNIKTMKARLSGIINNWRNSNEDLTNLVWLINKRLEGYMYSDEDETILIGRNWLRYFSLISHHGQLTQLDKYLTSSIRTCARLRGTVLTNQEIKQLGLISFVRLHYFMKRSIRQQHNKYSRERYATGKFH